MCTGMCSQELLLSEIVGIAFGSGDVFWWYVECIEVLEGADYGIELFVALDRLVDTM